MRIVFVLIFCLITRFCFGQFGSVVSASGSNTSSSLIVEWSLGDMIPTPVNTASLMVESGISAMNIIYLVTGDISNDEDETISVFPIPFRNEITIKGSRGISNPAYSLLDITGRKMETPSEQDNDTTIRLNTELLSTGTYLLYFEGNGKSKPQMFKLIKQ